ncbi:MAG: TetR/AcrR family transcriptional regulator [Acidobacteria bacterium]|nr:MAG: TetR/AcrR family transcriptional regulator [Acidobacteriota bacterium]
MRKKASVRGAASTPESRTVILRAAEHIFAERGLAGARIDAIARAAGVNKALIYYYFKSKDALYLAVVERHMKEFHQQALDLLGSQRTVKDKVLDYVSMHFDFIAARADYPKIFQRFIMADSRPFMRIRKRYFSPVARKFQAVIAQGIRSGEIAASDSTHTAISLVALTVFYFSAAPVLKAAGIIEDPYRKSQLARRKQEVLSFARRALFTNRGADSK